MSRSASLIARSVCAIIKLSMTSAFSTRPPVSTTMQGTSVRRANPYCRSRVSPGKSATNASRVPVMALNKVDLPTFGRPIRATTGSTSVYGCVGGAGAAGGSAGGAADGAGGGSAGGGGGAAGGAWGGPAQRVVRRVAPTTAQAVVRQVATVLPAVRLAAAALVWRLLYQLPW